MAMVGVLYRAGLLDGMPSRTPTSAPAAPPLGDEATAETVVEAAIRASIPRGGDTAELHAGYNRWRDSIGEDTPPVSVMLRAWRALLAERAGPAVISELSAGMVRAGVPSPLVAPNLVDASAVARTSPQQVADWLAGEVAVRGAGRVDSAAYVNLAARIIRTPAASDNLRGSTGASLVDGRSRLSGILLQARTEALATQGPAGAHALMLVDQALSALQGIVPVPASLPTPSAPPPPPEGSMLVPVVAVAAVVIVAVAVWRSP